MLVGRHFRMSRGDLKAHHYDVKTLAHLQDHEVDHEAFAQLCKYVCRKNEDDGRPDHFHFYRICLQDDRILDAVKRATSFIKLAPLLLYIAAHELVHVIRFTRGYSDFDAGPEEKKGEEEKVHAITRGILEPLAVPDMSLVIDCFSHPCRIGDIFRRQ